MSVVLLSATEEQKRVRNNDTPHPSHANAQAQEEALHEEQPSTSSSTKRKSKLRPNWKGIVKMGFVGLVGSVMAVAFTIFHETVVEGKRPQKYKLENPSPSCFNVHPPAYAIFAKLQTRWRAFNDQAYVQSLFAMDSLLHVYSNLSKRGAKISEESLRDVNVHHMALILHSSELHNSVLQECLQRNYNELVPEVDHDIVELQNMGDAILAYSNRFISFANL